MKFIYEFELYIGLYELSYLIFYNDHAMLKIDLSQEEEPILRQA